MTFSIIMRTTKVTTRTSTSIIKKIKYPKKIQIVARTKSQCQIIKTLAVLEILSILFIKYTENLQNFKDFNI